MTDRRDRDERREPDDQRERDIQDPLPQIGDPETDDPDMNDREQQAEMRPRMDQGDRAGRREDQQPDEPGQPRRAG
ncbi:MAG: hypothetical protein WC273_10225 [Dehalococcoidia bacterium]